MTDSTSGASLTGNENITVTESWVVGTTLSGLIAALKSGRDLHIDGCLLTMRSDGLHIVSLARAEASSVTLTAEQLRSSLYVQYAKDEMEQDLRAARAEADRLREVRHYVQNNHDVWSEPGDLLAKAYADIYQKVLNVIDTGDPMTALDAGGAS